MSMKVGELYGVLSLEKSNFDKGIKTSKLSFGSLVNVIKLGSVIAIAAIVAIAAAAVKLGLDYMDAVNTIRKGTGATGDDLQALADSMDTVARQVPEDLGVVAEALAGLNTRTGATGKELEGLTLNLLNLARVSGEDVQPLVASTTRLFGDWGIATEDQSATLDKLWRTSQNTGIGINELATNVVQFGSPLRLLGLDLDTTLAMFGKWEKEGVNTGTAMSGLKMAVKSLAAEGVAAGDMGEVFAKKIRKIKKSADPVGEAIKLFGVRAGPDLAAAIIEGKFELDDLIDIIENGGETIGAAALETQTFGDLWGIAMNNISVAVGENVMPVLRELLTWVQEQMPTITAIATQVGTGIGQAFARAGTMIGPLIDRILPLLKSAFETFINDILPKLISLWQWLNTNILPIFIAFGNLVVTVVEKLFDIFNDVATIAGPAIGDILDWISTEVAPVFEDMFTALAEEVLPALEDIFNTVAEVAGPALGAMFKWIAETILPPLKTAFSFLTKTIIPALKGAFDMLKNGVELVMPLISAAVETAAGLVETAFTTLGTAFDTVAGVINGAKDTIMDAWNGMVTFFRDLFTRIHSAVSTGWNRIVTTITNLINKVIGMWNEIDISIDIPEFVIAEGWKGVPFVPDMPKISFGPVHTGDLIPDIGKLATGTKFWKGGMAMLGEVGPELAFLPTGSSVANASDTRDLLERLASGQGQGGGPAVGTQNIYGMQPGDVEREMRRAMRRQALSWGLVGR